MLTFSFVVVAQELCETKGDHFNVFVGGLFWSEITMNEDLHFSRLKFNYEQVQSLSALKIYIWKWLFLSVRIVKRENKYFPMHSLILSL